MHKRMSFVSLLAISFVGASVFAAEPALPRKAGAPVVYQCPAANLAVYGQTKLFSMHMQSARIGTSGNLVCGYTDSCAARIARLSDVTVGERRRIGCVEDNRHRQRLRAALRVVPRTSAELQGPI